MASLSTPFYSYKVTARDPGSSARSGLLKLAHGNVPTPVFMPVGTQATVKTLIWEDLEALGYGMVLANTYHLWLRPGIEALERAGGLHSYMAWNKCVLTDSGGFQVFSLANRRRVDEEGVSFMSHVDGARHVLTPETVVQAQARMGVDVAMCLDECPPYPVSDSAAREMMERTLRWAARCRKSWQEVLETQSPGRTLLFPIVQGAAHADLRRESARRTVELDFPGYAVGGLSVGEPPDVRLEMLKASVSGLPADKPRYLMGVGKPTDIIEAVEQGIDMFDCVLPTRSGRNGQALTWKGPLNLRNAACREEPGPIDPECACPVCRRYSRRYLSHLFRAGEYSVLRLVSLHNLAFMLDFMRRIRESIEQSGFASFKTRFLREYNEAA